MVPASYIVSPIDLERLTNDADLIVIGRMNSVTERGHISGTADGKQLDGERMIATLGVEKSVKGDAVGATVETEFLIPDIPSAYQSIEPFRFGMFFLKRKADGSFRVLDPAYPSVVAPANATLTDKQGLDRTVDIVGQVLLHGKQPEDRRLAVRVLSSVRTAQATELLRQSTKDRDAVTRLQSISALLNLNDVATLDIAERILLNPPAGVDDYLLANISAALEGIKDVQAIPVLQRLLRSSDSRTRLGAISALRQMHDMNAVDSLVIALGDSNRQVRYEAVIGLAELTRQDQWAPAVGTFETDEQKYLNHWKEWARNR
jgi:FOG: HEAT repeat